MWKLCGSSRSLTFESKTTISKLGVVQQYLPVQGRYDCDISRSRYLVEPVSGGRQTWCRVSCLTMPIIHNDDAAPCISRTGTMVWSVAQYASPPPPPASPTSSCPSSDIVWLQRTTVSCTFDFWDQQPPSCSLVLALSMVWFVRQLLFCSNLRLRSSNTEKNIW